MSALTYLIGSTTLFFIGFYLGFDKGIRNGRSEGFNDGIQVALQEVDRLMRGGLKTPLDWDTARQLMQEKMSKN
ncbi:hypothetical protein ACKGJO_05240 [Gracilimonas sp. Q87]|uniref:hypothetical protein n=1 Tax=Gracilimonas sp. Q87 TaxID=3384766 RepID=UPI003984587E